MHRRVNYRRRLLRIVDHLIEGTPDSTDHAMRMLDALPRPGDYTVENLIWGPLLSMLSDSVYRQFPPFLARMRSELLGTSVRVERKYLKHDFRPEMTHWESAWYSQLLELLEYLREVGSERFRGTIEDAEMEYGRRTAAIATTIESPPALQRQGEEKVYRFVMDEATAILTNIHVRTMLRTWRYPVPDGTYSVLAARAQTYVAPDATQSIEWADRALHCIAGEQWMLITWHLASNLHVLSFH